MRLLPFLFLFISLSAFSQQNMLLSVKVKNHKSELFYLQKGSDVGITTLDSALVKASGILLFRWEGERNFYRLSDKNGNTVDFRMENREMSFEIKGDFSKPELIFDTENKNNQLQYYISEFDYLDGEAKRIADKIQEGNINDSDSKDLLKEYKTKQKESRDLMRDLWSKRSGNWTFQFALAKAVVIPDLNQKTKNRFFTEHYFEYFDFSDSLLIGTPAFYDKIDRFFKTSEVKDLLKRNNIKETELLIQQIFWLSETNQYAQECLANFLMKVYPENKSPELYALITKTYKLANTCEYILASKSMKRRMENDKNFTSGSKAPDFILENCLNRSLESFSMVNSDLTLLVVWSAHCEDSVDLLNRIKDSYLNYKDKGLEVVALSVDHNIASWENFVYSNNYSWVNACYKEGLRAEFASLYNITSTPTMFLVSSDFKLMSKPVTYYQFKTEVANLLD
jgi:DNA-binding transcriptional regulator PaaX